MALVLRNGVWQVVLRVPDPVTGKKKQVWRSTGERDRAKAKPIEAKLIVAATRGELLPTDQTPLGSFMPQWLETRAATAGLEAGTVASYRNAITLHILPALGKVKICDLTPAMLSAHYAKKLRGGRADGRPGGLSPHKVHEHHAVLHKALNDALKWGLITRNVADAVDAPAVPKVEYPTLSRQQARQLSTEARAHRFFALYRVASTTGLRQGGILALRWSDVDWDAGTVSVARAQKDIVDGIPVYGKTKTKRARSKVHLDPRDLTDLAAHRERQRLEQARAGSAWHPGDLIFCREDGTPFPPTRQETSSRGSSGRPGFRPACGSTTSATRTPLC